MKLLVYSKEIKREVRPDSFSDNLSSILIIF